MMIPTLYSGADRGRG